MGEGGGLAEDPGPSGGLCRRWRADVAAVWEGCREDELAGFQPGDPGTRLATLVPPSRE